MIVFVLLWVYYYPANSASRRQLSLSTMFCSYTGYPRLMPLWTSSQSFCLCISICCRVLESKTPPLHSYLVFHRFWELNLGHQACKQSIFFIAEPSPQPMSEHVSKSQPRISFTPSTFISFNTSHFTIHMCHILFTTTSHFTYAAFYLSARLLTGTYLYLWTTGNDVAVDIGLQKWFIQEHMLQ